MARECLEAGGGLGWGADLQGLVAAGRGPWWAPIPPMCRMFPMLFAMAVCCLVNVFAALSVALSRRAAMLLSAQVSSIDPDGGARRARAPAWTHCQRSGAIPNFGPKIWKIKKGFWGRLGGTGLKPFASKQGLPEKIRKNMLRYLMLMKSLSPS